jgi:hypothetical protein
MRVTNVPPFVRHVTEQGINTHRLPIACSRRTIALTRLAREPIGPRAIDVVVVGKSGTQTLATPGRNGLTGYSLASPALESGTHY